MELANILTRIAPVTVEYAGQKLVCQVFTEKLTPTYRAELRRIVAESEAGGESRDEAAQMLDDLIDSWDMVLNAEPKPAAYAFIATLSYPLIATIVRAITEFLGEIANPTNATS